MDWFEWPQEDMPDVDFPETYEARMAVAEDFISKGFNVDVPRLRRAALNELNNEGDLNDRLRFESMDHLDIRPSRRAAPESRRVTMRMVVHFYTKATLCNHRGDRDTAMKALSRALAYMDWYRNKAGGDIDTENSKPLDIAAEARSSKMNKEKSVFLEALRANGGLIKNRYPASVIKNNWDIFRSARLAAGLNETDEIRFSRRVNDWRAKDADFAKQLDLIFEEFRRG